jgi:SAM-dependent methyltransferase
MSKSSPTDRAFDAVSYWSKRHRALAGLRATGTLGAPVGWQEWLYKGKLRAYLRGFHTIGFSLRGCRALNFGCGTGYFEDAWESLGAGDTAGIDIVDDVIISLKASHPTRSYRAGDLANEPGLIADIGTFDLVTALDVFYHVLDDQALGRIVSTLSGCLAESGYFLFTDALVEATPAQHVKFRSYDYWEQMLRFNGLQIVHREPVFIVQNRPGRLARLAPRSLGALAYCVDLPLSRLVPERANNFAVFCTRIRA